MLSRRTTYVIAIFTCIIALSMLVTRPSLVPKKSTSRVQLPLPLFRPKPLAIVESTFLLLKTGAEVAYTRLPAHLGTTLSRFPNHAVYADSNATIGGFQMVDCLSFLPVSTLDHDEMLPYRIRRQMAEQKWQWGNAQVMQDGEKTGWKMDRFKNMPAFAEAWQRSKDYAWYVMIDADTYLSAYTLAEVVQNADPDEILYFGKAVGWAPRFAHGGSGIVLSRGAMRAIFGDTAESAQAELQAMEETVLADCCGDSVVSRRYFDITGKDTDETLQPTEFGQFQGNRLINMYVLFGAQWCKAVGSFHGVQPWEVYELDAWERKYEQEEKPSLLYRDFYFDFIMPHVRPEIPNWVAHDGPGELNRRKFEKYDVEAQKKESCIQACVNDEECTEWTFRGNESCILYRNLVVLGEAMNKYSSEWNNDWTEVATGFMVDRVRELRSNEKCDGLKIEEIHPELREGWFARELERTGRGTTNVLDYKQAELKPPQLMVYANVEYVGPKDHMDHKDHKGPKDHMDPKDPMDHMEEENKDHLEQKY